MANNIAKSIINGTYGINKEKEEEKLPISKQILNGNFTPSPMLPTSNYYTRGSIKMNNSNYYKKKYKEEKEKRNQLKNEIGKSFSNNGIEVNVNNFGTQRVALPIQERLETMKNNKFNYKNNSLERNLELEKEYQNVKKTEEYKKQEQKLIEQSNKIGYAKYDYDQSVVEEDNIGWFDKSIGTVLQGAKSVFDYSGGLVKNENGDFMYLPNKTELKQQKVQDSYDTDVGKFLGNAGYEIGKIAGTTVMNQVLPGAGSVAYFGKMYVDSTNNAIRDGYDTSSATLYGLVSVASEYLTGKFLGSATKGLTGGKTNAYETLLSNTFNKMLKKPMISQILANAGSEATEEFIQEYLDNITRLAILDKSSNIDDYTSIFTDTDIFADALYSAGIGAISGGVFGSVESIRNKNNNKIYQIYKDELLKTKKEISDKNKIEKIDEIIKKIDKIDTNKTVNEIVQQEQKKNSATAFDALKPQSQTPETNSGTSSLYINNNTNSNNSQIMPLSKNLQYVENNNVNMAINSKNNIETNNVFSNQVDEVLKGTFDKNNHMTVLEHTPEVLQKLGIQDYPITLTASKLDRIMNESGSQKGEYHNLGVDTVKKLPQALQNPLDIVKSHNNSYVLTTDLSDNQNRQVIASIKIDGKGYINNIEIDTNVMTSAYGRNNYDSWMKQHQDKGEIVYDVDRGYIDTKKLDIIPRLQLSNNNIKYSKSDVNDRVQFPMRDSSSNSTSDIIKNISPISYNNDSIKSDKSQILMPSTNINMQNNENNTNNRLIPQDPTKESTYDDAKMLKNKVNNDIKKGIIETKINKMLQSTSYKAVNKAAKTGQNYLTFNNNAKRHFKERLMSFVGKTKDEIIGTNSWNDIKNLVKEYSNKDLVYVDEELKSVKSGIRKTKIKINDALKNQITDYNEFRKDNFGKLNLSNEGIDIDSYYQELSEQYPQYFGSSTTSADMLYELSDFMNKDINIVEKFQFDDAYIEQTTAKIYNTLIQGTLNEQEINDIRNSLEDKMNARTRERVQAELLAEMGINESDISQGNDISSINLSRTDPIRVNEKVFGTKIGEKINNATIRKTQQNEAERIRFLNKERNEISKLGIKAFSKESAAVQKIW